VTYQGGPGTPPQYGQPSPSHQPKRRHRRLWTWLGITGGVVVVVIIIIVGLVAASPAAAPGPLPSSALGPSACVTAGRPAAASGPWRLVSPRKVCGLPRDTSAQSQQASQELVSATEGLLDVSNVGQETSSIAGAWETPNGTPNVYRSVTFVGFEGTFKPAAAVRTLIAGSGTVRSMPPGPHGGVMACATQYGSPTCVWATSTTLCEIQIIDTTRELVGANTAANAVRIRDVLEVLAYS
jgi:hypothetical protein